MSTRYNHWIGGKADPPAGGAYLGTIDPTSQSLGDEVAAGAMNRTGVTETSSTTAVPDRRVLRRTGCARRAPGDPRDARDTRQ